jgi:hypothetical protein
LRRSLKLFCELTKNAVFNFVDKPGRILIKEDQNHYIAPEGRRVIHPHVLINETQFRTQPGGRSIYEKFKSQEGDRND